MYVCMIFILYGKITRSRISRNAAQNHENAI
jgi:hypothetical protein